MKVYIDHDIKVCQFLKWDKVPFSLSFNSIDNQVFSNRR